MQRIDLMDAPAQETTFNIGGVSWVIRLKDIGRNAVAADISASGEQLLLGYRIVPNFIILPFPHLSRGRGNFVLQTPENELLNYQRFGDTQNLFYLTPEELAEGAAARQEIYGF